MELSRNTKILRFIFESVEIEQRAKQRPERIRFRVNGITFTTEDAFNSERDFLEDFIHCEKIVCKHCFKADVVDCEVIKSYLVWVEENDVMIVCRS